MTSTRSSEGPVRRTVRLMAAIADTAGPVTIQGLAERLELPPSTVHRLVQALRSEGLVVRHPTRAEYRIGPGWYRIAAQVVEGTDAVQLAQPVVERVGRAIGEACLFALYVGSEDVLTFAVRHRSPHPLSYRITMNQPLSLRWGASGKSILAHLPAEAVDRVLAAEEPSPTSAATPGADDLRRELDELRASPYVMTRGERLPGAVGIAAPVFDAGRHVVGSICLTVPEERFDIARTEEWGAIVRDAAAELSTALGDRSPR